jgi:hypothetical protein
VSSCKGHGLIDRYLPIVDGLVAFISDQKLRTQSTIGGVRLAVGQKIVMYERNEFEEREVN